MAAKMTNALSGYDGRQLFGSTLSVCGQARARVVVGCSDRSGVKLIERLAVVPVLQRVANRLDFYFAFCKIAM